MEELLLTLIFDNVENSKYYRNDTKATQIEESPFYKFLRDRGCLESLLKISYIQEQVEKKLANLMANDNSISISKVKSKLKLLYDTEIKLYGSIIMDYYVIVINNKIRSNPVRFEIELEKSRIKLLLKMKEIDAFAYLIKMLTISFNQNINILSRKLFLFTFIVLLKILGLTSLRKFMEYIIGILESSEISRLLSNLDFSLLFDSANYSYINLDSNAGFLKCFEQLLIELIGTGDIRFEDKNFEEENTTKINNKFSALVSFINLCESYIRTIRVLHRSGVEFNIATIYSFYSHMQFMVKYYNNLVYKALYSLWPKQEEAV
jgi:hypothetical protein